METEGRRSKREREEGRDGERGVEIERREKGGKERERELERETGSIF